MMAAMPRAPPAALLLATALAAVLVLAQAQAEKLVAVGSFLYAGGLPASHIAEWDGSAWTTANGGVHTLGDGSAYTAVDAVAVLGNNKVVAAGAFNQADGVSAANTAQWDGQAWSALGAGVDGPVYGLVTYAAAGTTYVAVQGAFQAAGGAPADGLAQWDGTAWSALPATVNGAISTSVQHSVDGGASFRLYVGGSFTQIGAVNASGLAQWDGAAWAAVGGGVSASSGYRLVAALTLDGADLYVGGQFSKDIDGAVTLNIAVYHTDTDAWSPLGAGMGTFGSVYALLVHNGDLYVGGIFDAAGGVAAANVAKWDGRAWTALGAGVGGADSGGVLSLAVFRNAVVAAGSFATAGGAPANNIAQWDGTAWAALGGGIGTAEGGGADGSNTVYGLAVYTPAAVATPPPPFNRWDAWAITVAVIVLVFALIGVVATGMFIYRKVRRSGDGDDDEKKPLNLSVQYP